MSFILRAYAIPHMHHVYYDEFTYLNIAENIYEHNSYSATAMGDKGHIEIPEAPIRPNGYPFMLSCAFRLFGVSDKTVFNTNVLLGALSVVIIFWITYLIFNSNLYISFWSAAIFNFLPVHLKYSGSGNSDIASLFLILSSILIILSYYKRNYISLLFLAIPVIALSAYFKPENLILSAMFLILAISLNISKKIRGQDTILLMCCMYLSIIPLLVEIPFMIKIENLNSGVNFLSLYYLMKNSLLNFLYLFDFRFQSVISTIFFILGALVLFFQEKKKCLLLFGWFLIFFLVNSSYFFGMFSLLYSTDSDRHFFPSAISFSILSGYGIAYYLRKIRSRLAWSVFILSLLIINSAFATEKIVNYTLKRDVHKENIFLEESANKIPNDLYVITYKPSSMITVINKKAIYIGIFNKMPNRPKKIVLFKGFWWFERKDDSALYERSLLKLYDFKPIVERRIKDSTYGFYLLTFK